MFLRYTRLLPPLTLVLWAILPTSLALAGVIVVIKGKDGQVIAKYVVPEGATVSLETTPEAAPNEAPKASAPATPPPPMIAKRYNYQEAIIDEVLRSGASVKTILPDGTVREFKQPIELPEGVEIIEISFRGIAPDAEVSLGRLRHLPKLVALDLAGTSVTDACVQDLREMPRLMRLALADTAFSGERLFSLHELQNLEELDLSGTAIEDDRIGSLQGFAKLRVLRLNRTQITEVGIRTLARSMPPQLRELYLNDTRLNDFAVPDLCRMTQLTKLEVHDARISKLGKGRLSRSLAGCEIVHHSSTIDFEAPLFDFETPARTDPPTKGELELQLADLRSRYRSMIDDAKSIRDQRRLARTLLVDAIGQNARQAYAYLREARDWGARSGDVLLVDAAAEKAASAYNVDYYDWLTAAWEGALADVRPETVSQVCQELMLRAEEVAAANRFDIGDRLLTAAAALAARSRTDDTALQVKTAVELLKSRRRRAAELIDAAGQLKIDRRNQAAIEIIARHRCFVETDWETGLQMSRLSADPWGKLAQNHSQFSGLPSRFLTQGDAWYAAGQEAEGRLRQELWAGAAVWYAAAAPYLRNRDPQLKTIETRLASFGVEEAINQTASLGPPRGIRLALSPSVGMRFALVPAGTFMMGTDLDKDQPEQAPAHSVTLTRPFYVGITEVTQPQWEVFFRGERAKRRLPATKENSENERLAGLDPLAVRDHVFGTEADQLVQIMNSSPWSEKFVFRLPTEAEWEYVAQFDEGLASQPHETALGESWFESDISRRFRDPVGRGRANSLGIFDLPGKQLEWCSDLYRSDYYLNSPQINPAGSEDGIYPGAHVQRGGAVRSRSYNALNTSSDSISVRIVAEHRTRQPKTVIRPQEPVQLSKALRGAQWVFSLHGKVLVESRSGVYTTLEQPVSAEFFPKTTFDIIGVDLHINEAGPALRLNALSQFEKLRKLTLTGTHLTDDSLTGLLPLRNLEELTLEASGITDQAVKFIRSFRGLKQLELRGGILGDASLELLATVTGLERLALDGAAVTDVGLEQLMAHKKLSILSLRNTKISDAGLDTLAKLSSLRALYVDGCVGLTQSGMDELRKKRPDLKLSWEANGRRGS